MKSTVTSYWGISSNENTIYSNSTRRFPVESYCGKNYIFIAYTYKPKSIFMIPKKSRDNGSMIDAYTQVYTKWRA